METKPTPSPAKRATRRSVHVVHFSYLKNVVPPRCRKPRAQLFHDGKTEVSIPVLTNAEAPVAFRYTDDLSRRTTYRFALGKLWVLPSARDSNALTSPLPATINVTKDRKPTPGLPFVLARIGDIPQTREGMKFHIRDAIRCYAIIGGRWYVEAVEPIYVIYTFGLGANHGSTALSIDTRRDMPRSFSLLQREDAIAAATQIAKDRGDTRSLPIKPFGRISLLLPEAIRFKPKPLRRRAR